MKTPSNEQLARCIELTLFAADATRRDIEQLCRKAQAQGCHGVCVNGTNVELARTFLEESTVQIVALVGFPLGAGDSDAKRYETEIAADQGAHEIDFVVNLGRLKDGDRNLVLREMRDIVEAADERPVKAVLESQLLTNDEKILACQLALDSGVKFVTTATDFHAWTVTAEGVKLLSEVTGSELGIKAVGRIRDAQMALALIEAGAARIGAMTGWANLDTTLKD